MLIGKDHYLFKTKDYEIEIKRDSNGHFCLTNNFLNKKLIGSEHIIFQGKHFRVSSVNTLQITNNMLYLRGKESKGVAKVPLYNANFNKVLDTLIEWTRTYKQPKSHLPNWW